MHESQPWAESESLGLESNHRLWLLPWVRTHDCNHRLWLLEIRGASPFNLVFLVVPRPNHLKAYLPPL